MDFYTVASTLPIYAVVISMVFGLLGAPLAALICAIISRVRGLGDSYAGTGAWYSMLFILPWIYLVLRMIGYKSFGSDRLAQLGYAILYGVWLHGAIVVIGVGLRIISPTGEFHIGEAVMITSGGLFIGCFWFVSLRRLLRRNETDTDIEPSMPMRAAYTTLHALWLIFAIGIALEGMANVKDNPEAAPVLYIASFVMAAIWVIAMFRFRFSKADEWDYYAGRPHSGLPLHNAYIMPFVHLYLLIIIPGLCGIMVWLIMLMLWAS